MRVSWSSSLGRDDGDAYDAFVASSPGGHPAQTRAWADVVRSGRLLSTRFVTVEDGTRLVGAALLVRTRIAGIPAPWASIDRGPVVDDPEHLGPCLCAIGASARAHGVLHLAAMPYWADSRAEQAEAQLARLGYRDAQRADGPHARTLRVALAGGEDALLAGPSMGQARWRLGQATKAGAVARRGVSTDWHRLQVLHSDLMRSQRMHPRGPAWWTALEAHLRDEGRGALFVCEHQGRVVSACVVLRHGALATYAWGASVLDPLPFTKAVPALALAMRWAQRGGCSTFDLGGVPLEGDQDPKRAAIATLKYDFARQPVRLVRLHARWLAPSPKES
jgi:lipid II:glycine glycyltransferase (peptidoglycan interpeptide bridge formation enzyme)